MAAVHVVFFSLVIVTVMLCNLGSVFSGTLKTVDVSFSFFSWFWVLWNAAAVQAIVSTRYSTIPLQFAHMVLIFEKGYFKYYVHAQHAFIELPNKGLWNHSTWSGETNFWMCIWFCFSFLSCCIFASVLQEKCTSRDLTISQGEESSKGIPEYEVEIAYICASNSSCAPSYIHLYCGNFASASAVNPKIFKRLSYDDCLVNDGKPLKEDQIIRFTYSNSFKYPLRFKFAKFC